MTASRLNSGDDLRGDEAEGSIYRPGFWSPDWIKVPIRHREEFVVAGYLPSSRGLGSLILGQYDRAGKFVYAGSEGRSNLAPPPKERIMVASM
jgi:hypothetical protein